MPYELYAIRYATNQERLRHQNFIGMKADPHDAALPMDFFVWLAVGHDRTVLIDTGCNEQTCRKRGHEFLRCPTDGLRSVGVEPHEVDTVIVTHLHWDHAGNFDKFPNAVFHACPVEIQHAVGPCMCNSFMKTAYDVEHVCSFVRLLYERRVVYHRGVKEVAPGLYIHETGGHTPGLQFVTVPTKRGRVAIASDAMHYLDNMFLERPFPVVHDVPSYFAGIDAVRAAADSVEHIVPGHDPAVMRAYPAVSSMTQGIAIRLDVMPNLALEANHSPH
ncbi:N-acyl homoserine lactonase family protein [Salinicola sp. MIT1003]|uniref:N-acyl homoserine lactonase family protein n=1 Tax=Salinicola sp. MIT1003 TaxID=1882734 RepID=UPI001B354556|nr:N-acyl homoserine lactonase family protein [Salinicola sp. MIT1003]